MVELARIDMITEVSMLSSYLEIPREGNLSTVFHISGYLEGKHNTTLVFDPTYPTINQEQFNIVDWVDFYSGAKEAIPLDIWDPRGKPIDLRLYVDSDFAGNKVTPWSCTGFIVYMNMAPVAWTSKKQTTVETSVFGSEFVAMKHGTEHTRGLQYKLRTMGVPIEGPAYVCGDNMSVIYNTYRPESTLKKNANLVCYHAIRESDAMGEIMTTHVPMLDNPADLCTKVISGGQKRNHLVSLTLYNIKV